MIVALFPNREADTARLPSTVGAEGQFDSTEASRTSLTQFCVVDTLLFPLMRHSLSLGARTACIDDGSHVVVR